jgi:hypothetical protein
MYVGAKTIFIKIRTYVTLYVKKEAQIFRQLLLLSKNLVNTCPRGLWRRGAVDIASATRIEDPSSNPPGYKVFS